MQSKHSKPVNTHKDIIIRRILISIIVICVVTVLIFIGISWYNNETKTKTTPEVISQITNTIPGYDFEKLKQTYPDIIGWIEVPNTNINMPLVQHPSNDFYYLQHGPQGNSDINGSAYIELCNKSNFSDPVTVIYGHTMNDHSLMFGTQHNFENPQFFNDNDKFYVFTPGHRLTYTVCSAYAYDDRHIINNNNFSDPNVVKQYFNTVMNPTSMLKNVRQGINLNENDKIVQLSTCMTDPNLSNQRYLLTGVLTNDEQTA